MPPRRPAPEVAAPLPALAVRDAAPFTPVGRVAGPGAIARLPAAARGYAALTKPRIIELLLVTTVPSMMLAAGGVPPLGTLTATLIAGTLAAGSANALNCYLDRDIDERMRRTRHRPLPQGLVSPRGTLSFGIALGVVATTVMALTTNTLATVLTVTAILYYVFGYTLMLKRRTTQNVVWGGAAGCMPVLIGWALSRAPCPRPQACCS